MQLSCQFLLALEVDDVPIVLRRVLLVLLLVHCGRHPLFLPPVLRTQNALGPYILLVWLRLSSDEAHGRDDDSIRNVLLSGSWPLVAQCMQHRCQLVMSHR